MRATLQLAIEAANRLTHEILGGLSANDLRAACTNAIIAHPLGIIHGVDHLFTGKVERVDTELLQTLLNQGIVPVISPLGFDGDGKTYRVNSDSVALAVAEALKAAKLIFITAQDGLRVQRSTHSPHAGNGLAKASTVREAADSSRKWFPRLTTRRPLAPQACTASTSSTAARTKGCSPKCSPTRASARLIYANEYEQIRPAKKKDIRAIQKLTKKAVEAEELVRRTRAEIEKKPGGLLHLRNRQEPGSVRSAARLSRAADRANSLAFTSIRRTKTRASAES